MIRVDIKQKHITGGEPGDPRCCAVALAVREATGCTDVIVDGMTIEVGDREYTTPDLIDTFIDRFDDGLPVEPVSFMLGDGS